VLFVLAATGGMLLLANNPRGGEELKDLLVGQILWVDVVTLWPAAIISLVVAVLWLTARDKLGRPGFYVLFALSVTISVQLIGVFLVFASLIAPAIAVRKFKRLALPVGYGVGVLGYLVGLMLSAQLDLPTGAIIVWSLVAAAILTAWLAPASLRR